MFTCVKVPKALPALEVPHIAKGLFGVLRSCMVPKVLDGQRRLPKANHIFGYGGFQVEADAHEGLAGNL